METGVVLAVIGAAAAAVLGGAGSSIGIGAAGSKGGGVLSEKPELFGKILIMTALPGSQGVYGLLIAIFILSKIGLFGGGATVSMEAGYQFFWAGILMGFAGLFSGIFQGKVVASGLGAIARDESLMGKAIVLAVIVETYAIFGLLVSLLIANAVQV
jgi:V/A-type H+-transporting ATPase subunit K